jgi:hypothetical protein
MIVDYKMYRKCSDMYCAVIDRNGEDVCLNSWQTEQLAVMDRQTYR